MTKINSQQRENERRLIDQNQRLLQHLNTGHHCCQEIQQLVSEVIGYQLDPTTKIHLPFYSDYGGHLSIGRHVLIDCNVMMADRGGITIGDGVVIGLGVMLITATFQLDSPSRRQFSIKIRANARIGAGAIILARITIGAAAIIGAGAVVTHDVAAKSIVVGNPSHVIKNNKGAN